MKRLLRVCPCIVVGSLIAGVMATAGGCASQSSGYAPVSANSPQGVAADIAGADLQKLETVWRRLGVTRERSGGSFGLVGRPAGYASGPFTAEVIRLDLDGSPRGVDSGLDAIVRVGDAAAWDWQYLAFLNTTSGWRYVGSVDLPNNKLGTPAPETVSLGPDRAWLVVKSYKEAGRNFTERDATWYQVRSNKLTEVLRVPIEGHRVGVATPFDVAFHTDILDTFVTPDNTIAVTTKVDVVYTNARQESMPQVRELFRRTGVVRYAQNPSTGRFTLDPKNSEWNDRELAALLTDNADEFLSHNGPQVAQMAASGDSTKKLWVSRLLKDCRESAIKTELSQVVDDR